jgi:hypothetical protein
MKCTDVCCSEWLLQLLEFAAIPCGTKAMPSKQVSGTTGNVSKLLLLLLAVAL